MRGKLLQGDARHNGDDELAPCRDFNRVQQGRGTERMIMSQASASAWLELVKVMSGQASNPELLPDLFAIHRLPGVMQPLSSQAVAIALPSWPVPPITPTVL